MIVLGLRAMFGFDGAVGRRIPPPSRPRWRGLAERTKTKGLLDYRFAQPLLRYKLLSNNDLQEVLPECCPKTMRERRILQD